jgi:hypothetical protein
MSWLKICTQYLKNRFLRGAKIAGPPIFIVGCGHSGTSLLLSILGAHSKIFAVPYESRIASHCGWRFCTAMWLFGCWAIALGKRRWVEKTPKHILRINHILRHRPDARVLLIIRDGRDVACSLKRRHGDLELGIRRWVDDNTEGKKYWNHPNVHVFKYESLIADFERAMTGVLAFIGEEYEPEIGDYHKSPKLFYSKKIERPSTECKKDHDQFRNWQINQPLFNNCGKWKLLSEEEKSRIHEIGLELLSELGYI